MNQLTQKQIQSFQDMIFSWWEGAKRDLPWRHTRDPYQIHVSEVMLQQTQVSRVLPVYTRFLELYPTVKALADAPTGEVLIAWKGMGYNRRALYLKQAAQIVTQEHQGDYPQQEKFLRMLPGVGIYTARAILVFAYNQQLAFVDTNIRQIIEHYFLNGQTTSEKGIQSLADQLLPKGQAWEWHQALMDYGSIELPKLNRPLRKRKTTSVPFTETNRFIRGKLIDLVRGGEWEESTLLDHFVHEYEKDRQVIMDNLNKLILEGLLKRDQTTIRLP